MADSQGSFLIPLSSDRSRQQLNNNRVYLIVTGWTGSWGRRVFQDRSVAVYYQHEVDTGGFTDFIRHFSCRYR